MDISIEKRTTINQMSNQFRAAIDRIRRGYQLLEEAEGMLKEAYRDSYRFDVNPERYADLPRGGSNRTERIILKLKSEAWRSIIEKMNIEKYMSRQRMEALRKQLEDPRMLPDISEDNIWGLFEASIGNLDQYKEEAIREVFDMLRPPGSPLKTNTEYEIGGKVILRAFYPMRWGDDQPHISYDRKQSFRNLDNIMHLLDGKGAVDSYHGPLLDAIHACSEFGEIFETEYFRCKAFKNGRIHIWFKRIDLVKELNAIAGGKRLRDQRRAS